MILEVFKHHWKSYLSIHIAVNVLSVAVLTPLATLLVGWLILISGQTALKDEDILLFAFSPIGSLVILLIAAIYTTLMVFEQAAMLKVSQLVVNRKAPGFVEIFRDLINKTWALFRLALQMIGRTVLVAAPFIGVGALVFHGYLSEYDINYYLTNRPPVFWWAGGLLLLIAIAMLALLLRVFSGWLLALPLLLLDGESPPAALLKSRQFMVSRHLRVTSILLGLFALNSAALALISWFVSLGVDVAIFFAGNSLKALALQLGLLIVIWAVSNIFVTFISNSTLSLVILNQYLQQKGIADDDLEDLNPSSQPLHKQPHLVIKIVGAALIASLVAGFVINFMMGKIQIEDHTQVIAHRGASADAPENTLAAMEEAINQGADWVEIDVQETLDGHVVVIHDSDLKKIGSSNLRISQSSLEELQTVDIGSWMDSAFSDQRVPTLEQLLLLCKDRVKVLIELKYYGHEEKLEERVANVVKATGMQDQIMVMSLNYSGIQKMRSIQPEWKFGLLSSVALGDITRLEADFFAINAKFAKRSLIRQAHQRNRKVLVWTVNDPISISAMISKGVDGVITDKPGLAVGVKNDRAELDLTERMIIQVASFLGKQAPIAEQ